MTPEAQLGPAAAPLARAAVDVLETVYQHRLLSARQLRLMHAPQASLRWAQHLVGDLARRGLVSFVRAGRGGPRLYFLTGTGADAIEQLPTRVETRRKLITPDQAAGPLRAHTLAVNDAGIAFLLAARRLGHDFGPLAWRHEIAHPIGRPAGRRRAEQLIADALLTYLIAEPDGALTFHYRFLELDRGTIPTDQLAAKLARYARLYHHHAEPHRGNSGEPAWRDHYPVFPGVLCVLAQHPRQRLERRRATTIALLTEDPVLSRTRQVEIMFCLLDDLLADGPFAAIFSSHTEPNAPVDWLGGRTSRPGRRGR